LAMLLSTADIILLSSE